jgi:hypothetical protein
MTTGTGPPRSASSGPLVARTYHTALGLVALAAWISLARQVHLLMGPDGLLPAQPLLDALARGGAGLLDAPSLLRLTGASSAALTALVTAGILLSLAQTLGLAARLAAALQAPLYLSFVVAGRTFFQFQWDQLLVESLALAALFPRDRRAPVAHALFRVLFVKLYLESGIAKWQSHLHDWQEGSAMAHYYETAPLPGPLAPLLHALPAWWHRLESWAVLGLELLLPPLALVPRRLPRLVAALALAAFQLLNLASASYGFFVLLSLALHLFLVGDDDLARAGRALARLPLVAPLVRLAARLRRTRLEQAATIPATPAPTARSRVADAVLAGAVALPWLGLSAVEALDHFAPATWTTAQRLLTTLEPVRAELAPLRLANAYHLFGHITTERIEPELETSVDDGATWQRHAFRYKPGDPARWPGLAAPHQPRVDFQLWFYALQYRAGEPAWVSALMARACRAPALIAPLFTAPLPSSPHLVRFAFERARFATPDERRATGRVWIRQPVALGRAVDCRR